MATSLCVSQGRTHSSDSPEETASCGQLEYSSEFAAARHVVGFVVGFVVTLFSETLGTRHASASYLKEKKDSVVPFGFLIIFGSGVLFGLKPCVVDDEL